MKYHHKERRLYSCDIGITMKYREQYYGSDLCNYVIYLSRARYIVEKVENMYNTVFKSFKIF